MTGTKLYDDLIMDHIRNARNFRALDGANHKARGANPLCGDEIDVYLKVEHGRIADIAFQCACCGISMASASMLTESVMGMETGEARHLLRTFVELLNARASPDSQGGDSLRRALLATVQEFPARVGCAALPWTTLETALDNLAVE